MIQKTINIISVAAVVLAIFLAPWVLNSQSLSLFKFFSPRTEQVRREVFETSKAYREGTAQELENLHLEYLGATTDEQRGAIRAVILHRTANFPTDALTPELQGFLHQLRQEH